MKWTDSEITPFLHSRYGYLLMSLTTVAAVTYAAFSTVLPVIDTPVLTGFAHASEWIHDKPLQLLGGIVLAVATSLLLVGVNKQYNVVRGLSLLYAALYLVFTAATPVIMANLSGGAVMAVVWLVSLIPLFSSFQNPLATRRVFITFCIVSAGCLLFMPVAALIYIPVYFAGCAQMRCLNLKCFLAALIGIVTTLWILFWLDIEGLVAINMSWKPSWPPVRPDSGMLPFYAAVAVTIVCGGLLGMFNLIKIYSYNARARANNGFITLSAVVTVALIFADSANAVAYVPLLNVCAAIQTGHFFSINNHRKSYIGIFVVLAAYAALYCWNV